MKRATTRRAAVRAVQSVSRSGRLQLEVSKSLAGSGDNRACKIQLSKNPCAVAPGYRSNEKAGMAYRFPTFPAQARQCDLHPGTCYPRRARQRGSWTLRSLKRARRLKRSVARYKLRQAETRVRQATCTRDWFHFDLGSPCGLRLAPPH